MAGTGMVYGLVMNSVVDCSEPFARVVPVVGSVGAMVFARWLVRKGKRNAEQRTVEWVLFAMWVSILMLNLGGGQ